MKKLFYCIGILTILSSCSQTQEPSLEDENQLPLNEREDIHLTRSEQQILNSQTEFAFNLFKTKCTVDNEINDVVSPLSAVNCLGMLANGLKGGALEELMSVMLPKGGSLEDLNELNRNLVRNLVDVDNSTKLVMTNSLWSDTKVNINKDFSNTLSYYFNAYIRSTDMYSISGAEYINNWVNENTNGLIPSVFKKAPNGPFTLLNTLYFKGRWVSPFDKENTDKEKFTNYDGSVSKIQMMNRSFGKVLCEINHNYSAISLPFGNHAFSFVAILPGEDRSIDSFIKEMDIEKWGEIKKSLIPQEEVNLKLPRFKVNYKWENLRTSLQTLGVTQLFSDTQATTDICDVKLDMSNVYPVQQTVLIVDENGAEGASETHFDWYTSSLRPIIPKNINLNRPFIYVIEEISTGAVLFIGKIDKL